MKIKQVTLDSRKAFIQELYDEINRQKNAIEIIEAYNPSGAEEEILHLYTIHGAVKAVADIINERGYRIGKRKYTTNDISDVINQKPTNEIHIIAKDAFNQNKQGVRWYS